MEVVALIVIELNETRSSNGAGDGDRLIGLS